MAKFWEKWFISASSGCLGRLLIFILVGVIGIFGIKFILPNDDSWTRLITPTSIIILFLMGYVFGDLHTILNWLSERKNTDLKIKEANIKEKEASIRELELKKEILELEQDKESIEKEK